MNESGTDNKSDSIRVTLASSKYTTVPGKSVEVVVFIANPGPMGDYFKVNLLGIPPGWITFSGMPGIWVPAGGQETVIINITPPVTGESVIGPYPGRLHVFSQSTPERGQELEIIITVLPEEAAKKAIQLHVQSNELQATPGTNVKIQLTVDNLSQDSESLELAVQGVPANWISLPSPVVNLLGGEEKKVDLLLQIPSAPEIRTGYFPLKISAVSQKDPTVKAEVAIRLGIAAFESQGRVGVMLRSVQFSTAPGGSLTIPLTVLNRGLESDIFRLGIKGIPPNWISTSNPVTPLEPGENKEISLMIRPPLNPSSKAGRYKFSIMVASQGSPDQKVKADCLLTVAAYTQFSAELERQEVEAGQPFRVSVKNNGNTQQVFQLTFVSENDQLIFEYLQPDVTKPPAQPAGTGSPGTNLSTQQNVGMLEGGNLETPSAPLPQAPGTPAAVPTGNPTLLPIAPGDTAAFRFSAKPRTRPILGGAVPYPFHVSVKSNQKEVPAMSARVIGRGLIPGWILIIVLFLGMCLLFSSGFFLLRGDNQANSATQTSAAAMALTAGPTQTMLAGTAVSAGATQTIIANWTAAAISGQQDTDGDGLTNQREAEIGTDPSRADSDNDGLMDGEEALQTRTNPLAPDTDMDGLNDGDEVRMRTDPLNPDTDRDNSRDGDEVRLGTNPLNPDTDNDGLPDGSELMPCPNPLNPDTDQDGITDGKDQNACDASNPALTPTVSPIQPTVPVVPPTSPSLPTYKGTILFTSDRDGNSEIYSVESGSQIRRITNNTATDNQPAWSPDKNKYIAFTSNRDGQNEIYVMNADGTSQINLTNNPGDDQYPSWSADGEWIAFSSNREGNYEIYIINVSTRETRNLTNSPGNDTQPNWVPNKSVNYIVFTSDRDGNREIYRMKTDGSGAINLTVSPTNDQMARGSYDGARLVFTTDRDGNLEIYSMNMDGGGQVNLTNNPANDYGPSISPDQSWVAFTSDRNGNREVYFTMTGFPEQYNLTNSLSQEEVSDWR